MIRLDLKNSVNKSIFMDALQYSHLAGQIEGNLAGKKETDQHLIFSALKEIEQSNEKSAVGLVNALFLSSTSHALDKVCLNIFSRMGDEQSLQLLYKKYPTPESISISLLPFYIRSIGFLGGAKEIETLSKYTNTFWGLYKDEVLQAYEDISRRVGRITVSADVVNALMNLYEAGDESERKRVVELSARLSHQLFLAILLTGIYSDTVTVRRAAIDALGTFEGPVAHLALQRAFRHESEEELLEAYVPWLFHANDEQISPLTSS